MPASHIDTGELSPRSDIKSEISGIHFEKIQYKVFSASFDTVEPISALSVVTKVEKKSWKKLEA